MTVVPVVRQAFNSATAPYVSLGQPTNLNFKGGTDAFTIVADIKTTSAANEMIVAKSSGAHTQYFLGLLSGKLRAGVGDAAAAVGTRVINDGQLHQVAVVVTTSGYTFYVDVFPEASVPAAGAIDPTMVAMDVLVGARRDASNTDSARNFTGTIDAQIFAGALTVQDLGQLYAASRGWCPAVVPPPPPPPPPGSDLIGMYSPDFPYFESATTGLNVPAKTIMRSAFIAHTGGWANYLGGAWFIAGGLANGYDPARPLTVGVGFFPKDETPLPDIQHAASGAYNAHYTEVAQAIAGYWPNAIIRPAWEFQGDWYPWGWRNPNMTSSNYAADYVAAFRNLVTAFRAVSAGFKFVFNPALPQSWDPAGGVDYRACYPGDAYVDYVGPDVYDFADPTHPTPQNRWDALQSWGANDVADLAHTHGKLYCLPEYGAGQAGDNPLFITNLAAIYKANPGYQAYWSGDSSSGYNGDLTLYPNEYAEFVRQFKR